MKTLEQLKSDPAAIRTLIALESGNLSEGQVAKELDVPRVMVRKFLDWAKRTETILTRDDWQAASPAAETEDEKK